MAIAYVKADLDGVRVEGELLLDDPSKSFVLIMITDSKFLGVTGTLEVPRNQILEIT